VLKKYSTWKEFVKFIYENHRPKNNNTIKIDAKTPKEILKTLK